MTDDLHLLLKRTDACTVNMVPQELKGSGSELALGGVEDNAVVA